MTEVRPVPVEQRTDVSAARRELLARRLRGRAAAATGEAATGAATTIPVVPREPGVPLPVSYGQQRLWFLSRLEPDSAEYHVPVGYRLHGRLDEAALRRALESVVARHEVLRTRLVERDGVPAQVVDPDPTVPLCTADLSGLDRAAAAARLEALAAGHLARPFDLAAGPRPRALLARLAADEHVLLLAVHHIAFDQRSAEIVRAELAAAYRAYRQDTEPALPDLPVQYADYAAWQRGRLAGPGLDAGLRYWRERLAGIAPLEVPADRPRPAVRDTAGGWLDFDVPAATVAALPRLAAAHRATEFMLLLAAFGVLLARYTGRHDVAVGTPVAGRDRPELENLVGFFVNTLVLRADLPGDPTFEEVLDRVRDTALGAFSHADVPFERLVEELSPDRAGGLHPLFQVVFEYRRAGGTPAPDGGGLRWEPYQAGCAAARFDLVLAMTATGDGLRGRIGYRTARYGEPTVRRLAGHFTTLLAAAVADPTRRIADLPLLGPAERRLLAQWNDTDRPHEPVTVPRAVRVRDPGAVAVRTSDGASLAYADLEERSNRLAHRLRDLGAGPEVPVGVCLPIGADLVVTALAVWKAGGGYLPLDPDNPPERVAAMLAEAAAPLVVTATRPGPPLPAGVRAVVLDDPAEAAVLATLPSSRPVDRTRPDNLAYVIFTSGSTGRPKGVLVSHRSLDNFVRVLAEHCAVDATSRVAHLFAPGFDPSVSTTVMALAAGASLHLYRRRGAVDGAGILRYLRDEGVTSLHLPPALLAALPAADLPALRAISSGGERWASGVAARWATGRRVYCAYGTTETTVVSSLLRVGPDDARPRINRPFANTRFHLLDAAGQPVPIGIPGELYVGGVGVARGYAGRPELTAERFVADPFAGGGGRLYRTGDRMRWLADGTLEFLGRVDDQLKIRGHRVEPGEVEAVLATHPTVRRAVVAARPASTGGLRLVGYVVPADGRRLPAAELRAHLAERLPAHAVPAELVAIDAVPLGVNGKVDRSRLPDPADLRFATGDPDTEAPESVTEQVLASVWAELLGRDRIGRGDDFFDLGGHSLLATTLVARVGQALGVEVPVRAVFDHPTLAAFAAAVDAEPAAAVRAPDRPIPRMDRSDPLPASFAQQRLWFLDQLNPGNAEYTVLSAWRLTGDLDVAALRAALGVVIARHEALRTRFVAVDGEPRQVIDQPGPVDLPVVGVPDGHAGTARRLAAAAGREPFDLGTGPLLRARLLSCSPTEHVFVLVMHHIVSDQWSAGILRRELAQAYRAVVAGAEPRLPDLPVQYPDYAVWQRERLSGAALEVHLAYWRERLAGLPVLDLPTDRPRAAVRSTEGGRVPVEVPAGVVEGLRGLGRAHGVTPFMVLLGVWVVLLSRCCGQRDVAVGSPVAGRSRVELEGVVGFFVNTLVLRVDVSGDPSFVDVLGRVRRVVLGAFGHADVPFERLVEELAPQRDLSRTPLVSVLFDFHERAAGSIDVAGVEVTDFPVGCAVAPYDLSLSLTDTGAGLRGGLEYASALFDAVTVERLVGHFVRLVAGVVAEPGRAVSRVRLLSAAEEAELAGWNATGVPFPPVPVPERIAELARSSRAAVRYGAQVLSYRELEERVGRLAGRLRAAGVGRGDVVGVGLPRGVDVVVAMLAVWRVGAAYLPMDVTQPAARLALLMADAGARLVVSTRAGGGPFAGTPVLCLDEPDGLDGRRAVPSVAGVPSLDDAAWVVFTSGSSGWPKGVVVSHRSVAQVWWAWCSVHGDVAGAVWLSVAGESFDVFSADVVRGLAGGGGLVIGPVGVAVDPAALVELIITVGVTAVECPPAVLAGLVEYLVVSGRSLPGLRLVVVASELLPAGVLGRAREVLPGVRIGVAFGLTETSVDSTFFDTTGWSGPGMAPVGRPLPNTTCHVLDEAGVPVPVGVPGELVVGGAGVGWGYVGRPDLTAERFLADPFAGDGSRVYRTGDRVRWRRGGVLEFLGRLDEQLSVRGFRVEPAEVEAVLAACPGVAGAAVAVREDRLIGYLVPAEGVEVDPGAARAVVRERLPGFMVPDLMVVLGRLPVTVTGKVDRRALPAPGVDRAEQASFREPGSATGRRLAELWAGLLGVQRVGGVDDFFRLGGHSLLATRLIARVRAQFGVDLPVRVVFETPTLDEFAAVVDLAIDLAATGSTAAGPLEYEELDL